ncbi:hypothetical protein PG984_013651 [Apiospora sp. TS-2023a]
MMPIRPMSATKVEMLVHMATPEALPRALLTAFFWDRRRKPSLEVRNLLALVRKSRGALLALQQWNGAPGVAPGRKELGLVWTLTFAKNMSSLDLLKTFDYGVNSISMMPVDGKTCTGSQLLELDESEWFISEETAKAGRRPNSYVSGEGAVTGERHR